MLRPVWYCEELFSRAGSIMSDAETPLPADKNSRDDHRDLDELGDRLREVKKQRETKSVISRPDNDDMSNSGLGIGLRIGMELIIAVMMGIAIGWFIDRTFGTKPWGLMVFSILGMASGVLNVIRVANKMNETGDDQQDKS